MNAGNLIVLLLIVGGLFAMFFMHRGGGRGHGGMGGCGGHGDTHGDSATDEHQEKDKQPPLGKPGPHGHDHDREPATTDAGRSGS